MLRKCRQVLRLEALWLQDVQYQFTYGLREEVFENFKMFLKYSRVKNARKLQQYDKFVRRAKSIVEESRLR